MVWDEQGEVMRLGNHMKVERVHITRVVCSSCGKRGPSSGPRGDACEARAVAERLARWSGWVGKRGGETLCPKCKGKDGD